MDYGVFYSHLQDIFVSEQTFFEIGLRIAAVRGKLSQTEFADQLGVDRKTVGQWERGERVPAGTALIRLASVFSADITYILTGVTSTGPVATLPPDESALLDNYRHCGSDDRERIRQISNTAAQSPKRKRA